MRMQQKYLDQFYMLYDDFHITKLPLLPEEVKFGLPNVKHTLAIHAMWKLMKTMFYFPKYFGMKRQANILFIRSPDLIQL